VLRDWEESLVGEFTHLLNAHKQKNPAKKRLCSGS